MHLTTEDGASLHSFLGMTAVVRSLRELGVPRAQVHDERFSLAS